jgi:hypothetical protein
MATEFRVCAFFTALTLSTNFYPVPQMNWELCIIQAILYTIVIISREWNLFQFMYIGKDNRFESKKVSKTFAKMHDGLILVEKNSGKIVMSNRSARELFGGYRGSDVGHLDSLKNIAITLERRGSSVEKWQQLEESFKVPVFSDFARDPSNMQQFSLCQYIKSYKRFCTLQRQNSLSTSFSSSLGKTKPQIDPPILKVDQNLLETKIAFVQIFSTIVKLNEGPG